MSRRWEVDGDMVAITDRLTGRGAHRLRLRLTVPQECIVRNLEGDRVEITRPEGDRLDILFPAPVTIGAGWYSPGYGVAMQGTYIEMEKSFAAPEELRYECHYAGGRESLQGDKHSSGGDQDK